MVPRLRIILIHQTLNLFLSRLLRFIRMNSEAQKLKILVLVPLSISPHTKKSGKHPTPLKCQCFGQDALGIWSETRLNNNLPP
jgi:hypothetical protein